MGIVIHSMKIYIGSDAKDRFILLVNIQGSWAGVYSKVWNKRTPLNKRTPWKKSGQKNKRTPLK